ncbi:anhydro-N-acetylmuramic acid kinase AnmK [Lederbergia wuyishanensis]|uniref:Anhydro-N-acetylmuramic acid kinase n=1 Tax=Lederbergia wuyishanensis TaxID=1347903 RepID=A0ABU0D3S7_9BACI|nr:anhydro-N-acetylmuramic acid kinase AnmK [Lederbergia wuyishanensis]MCJ8007786.1 anhydro-N-acetylmuramic acid kinase AnmK [Lederbergia wuyishanensis]MDQ0343051.1 anhydro-N-acetylmuramic acid kinase [Lederbergia wuyishanensis]
MEKLAVGLMSGTSVDGIDAALVRLNGFGIHTKVELIDFITLPFPPAVAEEILQCMDINESNSALICSLNFKLGYLFADAVKKVCEKASIPLRIIDFIASHGQTIYHLPQTDGRLVKSTLQIGEPAVIAYETGTTVISNFRTMDMAAGGEGAPLVPYADYVLYRSNTIGRSLQNIGGIGNVTVLPKQAKLDDVIAFDTGPGNMVIDSLCNILKGESYDQDGKWAAQGKIHKEIAQSWLEMDFFKMVPPKSTGRELFGSQFTKQILQNWSHLPADDLIATATYFTALSIADSYKRYIFPTIPIDELIIGGGGGYNKTLLQMITELLPNTKVLTQEDIGFSSEAKEAIAFAILGNETMNREPSNVPKATGAKGAVILGSITLPPRNILLEEKYEDHST